VKVVLLENIHPLAAEAFRRAGFEVDARPGSLSEHELSEVLQGVSLLGIRSNTTITRNVLEAGKDLLAVGCFCIGTNQVDLGAAAERGVAVFNAPFSNTRSVVELVLGEITTCLERGETVKLSSFGSFVVRKKGQRIGRNPKTGKEVPISPRRVMVFKPSAILKQRINGAEVADEAED